MLMLTGWMIRTGGVFSVFLFSSLPFSRGLGKVSLDAMVCCWCLWSRDMHDN